MFGFTLIRTRDLRAALADRPVPPVPASPLPPLAPPATPEPSWEAEPPAIVRELIRLADRLPDLTGGNTPADPEQAAGLARWLEGRAQSLLTACDVTRIEETGALDLSRHEVVGTRTAPADQMVQHIADTVRPGYSWHGRLLRPQQVVAYVAHQGDARNEGL